MAVKERNTSLKVEGRGAKYLLGGRVVVKKSSKALAISRRRGTLDTQKKSLSERRG